MLVFPKLIFPFVDPLTGTLYSFGVFALAFIARPVGSVIFQWLDRHYGKGIKLTIAIFARGCSTVAMAFLPGYGSFGGYAVAALIILRLAQGLSLGGVWDGLPSLLALNAPRERRGWYAMIPQLGAPFGLLVASALFAFFASSLSADDFLGWGWRYPFFVAFAINVVALFARLRIVMTPAYEHAFESRELEEVSIGDYVLSGGEIAALALIDACIRLLPGVMGKPASGVDESFSEGLLEYPQYTRPQEFEGLPIPDILLSGDHARVAAWRRAEAEALTKARRPDLWTIKVNQKRPKNTTDG